MRHPRAGAPVLTCWAAVLLLLCAACHVLGGVQGVGREGLRLKGGGGALWWWGRHVGCGGQGRRLIAPGQWRAAQAWLQLRLLWPQQPALGLLVQSAPLGLQAAVIPLLLAPLRAETKGQRSDEAGKGPQPTHRAHRTAEGRPACSPITTVTMNMESDGHVDLDVAFSRLPSPVTGSVMKRREAAQRPGAANGLPGALRLLCTVCAALSRSTPPRTFSPPSPSLLSGLSVSWFVTL